MPMRAIRRSRPSPSRPRRPCPHRGTSSSRKGMRNDPPRRRAGLLAALLLLGLIASGGCRRGHDASLPTGATAATAFRAPAMQAAPDRIERDVRYLAADARAGRGPGSRGLEEALRFVARRFRDVGLTPVLQEHPHAGDALDAYRQPFDATGYPPSSNLIGILPAQPRQTSPHDASGAEIVIVAAHVDHLGRDAELAGDQIYNGADDNASGVAVLLEVARLLAQLPHRERAVLFIAFSGEEAGLIGSRYFVAHPVVPLERVRAMINLDSVGKLREERLIVFGRDSAREWPAILAGVNYAAGFDLVAGSRGVEGSDHRSFREAGIPALHLFTGAHRDFSTVRDEADGLNYRGLARITNYVAELTRYLTYRDRPLTFVASRARPPAEGAAGHPGGGGTGPRGGRRHPGGSGPPDAAGGGHPRSDASPRRVSLGFMPDFAGQSAGVRVAEVTAGSAADEAGLQAGDVITALDGEPVTSLQDYTVILRRHVPGDAIRVRFRRAGSEQEAQAVLQERR
ncbi:MAG: M28 family peptidase [Candidatus Eisenbacteria bacterium]|nr:M28 family peptidase [Candidatus Eisenbacteria bacterium]